MVKVSIPAFVLMILKGVDIGAIFIFGLLIVSKICGRCKKETKLFDENSIDDEKFCLFALIHSFVKCEEINDLYIELTNIKEFVPHFFEEFIDAVKFLNFSENSKEFKFLFSNLYLYAKKAIDEEKLTIQKLLKLLDFHCWVFLEKDHSTVRLRRIDRFNGMTKLLFSKIQIELGKDSERLEDAMEQAYNSENIDLPFLMVLDVIESQTFLSFPVETLIRDKKYLLKSFICISDGKKLCCYTYVNITSFDEISTNFAVSPHNNRLGFNRVIMLVYEEVNKC